MYTSPTSTAASGGFAGKLQKAEAWLDRKGKFAWIAAMVLGFILFWPLGLALMAYMIWSKRMFSQMTCNSHRLRRDWTRPHAGGHGSSGNSAFDTYKAEALRRLEEEQEAFEAFIERLREAKDKAQFDNFMEDRARANRAAPSGATETQGPGLQGPETQGPDARGGAY